MESIEKVGFANGATERLSEINLNDFLTDAEFSHKGYHPMRDFLSAIADVTIILPLVEGIMGYDFITQEELTDLERGFKIGGALVDAFTLGASGVFTNAGIWATSGVILKTMATDAALSGVTYVTNEMLVDAGLPPAVAAVMTVIASGVVTYSAGRYFFKNASGDLVAEYTESELRQIFKEIDDVEIPPVRGSAVEEAIEGSAEIILYGSEDIAKYQYNMIENPGPLADIADNPAKNFYGGRYNVEVLTEDRIYYRGGNSQNPLGQWFTTEAPESVAKVRIDTAVKPQWIDPATGELLGESTVDTVYAIKIPKGTTVYTGPVGPQGGGSILWWI